MAKILVADDEQNVRFLLGDLLRQYHHDVVTVADGEKAMIEVQRFMPDLIILDIMMPKLDGYGVQKKLFEDYSTRKIPIIILTAMGKTKGLFHDASNVVAFMEKPFINDELVKKVNEVLASKPS